MRLFHRRCHDVEALLTVRIKDMEEQNSELLQRIADQEARHIDEVKSLFDRLLAVVNPQAAAVARSLQPARPVPVVTRDPGRPRPRIPLPGQPTHAPRPPAYPVLTPDMERRRREGPMREGPPLSVSQRDMEALKNMVAGLNTELDKSDGPDEITENG